MTSPGVFHKSFHAGEWAPALNARVDLAKYHAGAALLRNFYVDYRGGASTRTGTKYIAAGYKPTKTIRLIPFQASFSVGYVLEFGDYYIRFYFNGAQVLSGGSPYTLPSPYSADDLSMLKFAMNVDKMILTHSSYPPYELHLISATNWTLTQIQFGSNVSAPTNVLSSTTVGSGSVNYAYLVTSVDANGQESSVSDITYLNSKIDISVTAGTNSITWTAASGALSYNVYKAEPSYTGQIAVGAAFGYIGNCTGAAFADTNIPPDFSTSPPIVQNPFYGSGVDHYTIGVNGTYTTLPTVTISAPPGGGAAATGQAYLGLTSGAIFAGGGGYSVGNILRMSSSVYGILCSVQVTSIGGGGTVTGFSVYWHGSWTGSGTAPNLLNALSGDNPGITGTGFQINNSVWGVYGITPVYPGAGYVTAPTVTFSSGTATATATLAASTSGNPSTVTFFQQRLVLAAPPQGLQTFYMSQTGAYYNYNVSNPIKSDDAITSSIVAGQLNEIKSMVSVPAGLMLMTNNAAWMVNGGSYGTPVTPSQIAANAHSYNGIGDVPPIIANFDVLYVQAKGSIVRDITYNFYANIFTGTDISVLSSHLFYGYTIREWAWAQEPFKVVWAVRNDGTLLSLTYLKEQELIGWAHSDTNGTFKSVATITETVSGNSVDAVYVVVQRTINGSTVQYIERFAERNFTTVADAWCVDAAKQYSGAPATNFSGAAHLAGATVTGLADGNVITPFTMPVSGNFTLSTPASKVTIGLAFTPQLQTLNLDIGDPTIQGRRKKVSAVTVRVQDTLGLSIGKSFSSLVAMKDLVIGNVGSQTNELVTGLVTGDARTIITSQWDEPGQFCIQQSYPLPATILGVIPEITKGDTDKFPKRGNQ